MSSFNWRRPPASEILRSSANCLVKRNYNGSRRTRIYFDFDFFLRGALLSVALSQGARNGDQPGQSVSYHFATLYHCISICCARRESNERTRRPLSAIGLVSLVTQRTLLFIYLFIHSFIYLFIYCFAFLATTHHTTRT